MKVNLLISYAYKNALLSPEFEAIRPQTRLLVDSGAFTAMNSGKPVVLSEYHKFLTENASLIDEYIQLDVVGDPEATRINLEKSYAEGFSPIPVFTAGATIGEYKRLVKEYGSRICIGGITEHGGESFIDGIFANLGPGEEGEPHFLGYTSLSVLGKYTPKSADTSSWSASIRFSSVQLWDGRQHFSVPKAWFQEKRYAQKMSGKITTTLRKYGIDYRELRDPKAYRHRKGEDTPLCTKLTIRSELQKMIDIKRYFDVDYYLAVSDRNSLRWIKQELDFFKGVFNV